METDRKDSLEERSRQLREQLAKAQAGKDSKDAATKDSQTGYSQALKLSSEFVAAVVVGAMLGFLLDWALPTKPWGLIVFLLLGFCAGILNVLRSAGVVSSPHPVDRVGEVRKRDEER